MSPPASSSRVQRVLKLAACLYFLLQLRKLFLKLTRSKHSQTYRKLSLQPSSRLFPRFFESTTHSGLWIFHRDWAIPAFVKLQLDLIKPKGIIIISHGLAEHITRYDSLAQQLNHHGFACFGLDHQGHGLSDGDRSYVERFQHYVDDLLYFSEGVRDEYAEYEVPLFLLGHSMGGLIATYAAQKKPSLFDGVILSSPFMGVAPHSDITNKSAFLENALRALSECAPKLKCVALDNKRLSQDETVLYRLERDALHYKGLVCIRTVVEMVDAARAMVEEGGLCHSIEWPYLLVGGGDDVLCDGSKWHEFHARTLTKKEDKDICVFKGMWHECLNEKEGDKVCSKVLEWLTQRCDVYEYEGRRQNIEEDVDKE